ncbi:hypothetical protein TrRE_jg293 [Triparma retinervis]|uniref:Uncharacterized protein n=1 Tax=Triparma retinervis TaxID=2557542 RepID=A0A9W7ADS1_9STRA|nr:hypothetical protein TrRE_jg293 [Triparma retinervis]
MTQMNFSTTMALVLALLLIATNPSDAFLFPGPEKSVECSDFVGDYEGIATTISRSTNNTNDPSPWVSEDKVLRLHITMKAEGIDGDGTRPCYFDGRYSSDDGGLTVRVAITAHFDDVALIWRGAIIPNSEGHVADGGILGMPKRNFMFLPTAKNEPWPNSFRPRVGDIPPQIPTYAIMLAPESVSPESEPLVIWFYEGTTLVPYVSSTTN